MKTFTLAAVENDSQYYVVLYETFTTKEESEEQFSRVKSNGWWPTVDGRWFYCIIETDMEEP